MSRRLLRWSGYVLVAIVFAIVCAFLSNWQFARNETRAEQIALVERNYDAAPEPLASVIGQDGRLKAADEWRPVAIRGEYLADEQVLARNRPYGGTSAFEVLVPFRDVSGRVFVVDRGWVPPGDGEGPDAVPAPPSGQVEVIVRLRPTEALPRSGRGAPKGQVPTVHIPSVAAMTGENNIVTSAYGQLVSEDPAPKEALGGFELPTEDPGPHLSYAIQWILFAAMGFIFIGYIIRTEIQKHREERDGAPASAPRKRSRDRDGDIEDALLDSAPSSA